MFNKAKQPALTDDPKYAAAQAKLAELEAKRAELEQRQRQAMTVANHRLSRLDVEAARLLGNEVAVAAPDDGQASIREELRVLNRAIELQNLTVQKERTRVSQVIAESYLPEHRKNVGALAAALKQLLQAARKEQQLRDSLSLAGISYVHTLRPLGFVTGAPIRGTDDLAELVDCYLKEAQEYGLL